jgi:stage III sporulation protein SpoIIIAA
VPIPDRAQITDDLHLLLDALPPEICARLMTLPPDRDLIEVVMDLGRAPEARFGSGGEEVLLAREIGEEDIQYVIDHVGSFGDDNRAGIERTLHRISAIRNRSGKIVGLTCRIGRAVVGTIEIVGDLVESGKSILIMGRPGVGKTTMLREAARVLADDFDKRVVVVDTSNEIAGDGDIPHPGIGRARRMQVQTPALQHGVMIEAVENHMPEVIVIDEIGTELEAAAARTIAERGVQLIGTAHGNNLDNLMLNPTLSDLIGGIQSVTLGDEEARRRRTQKSVLERKAPPTFDVVVEIQERERVTVHADVAETVDALLRGDAVAPELRWRDEAGVHRTQSRPRPSPTQAPGSDRFTGLVGSSGSGWRVEPGWRPDGHRFDGATRDPERTTRPGYRPGTSGGWRAGRGRGARSSGGPGSGPAPWEGDRPEPPTASLGWGPAVPAAQPFLSGEIADRGPVERGSVVAPEPRARDSRELVRQRAWRDAAARAISTLRADEGVGPVPEDEDDELLGVGSAGGASVADEETGARRLAHVDGESDADADDGDALDDYEEEDDEAIAGARAEAWARNVEMRPATTLRTINVVGFGISRKKLEQAIRHLDLPVQLVVEVEDADALITLRNYYRQKAPALREAEERALPIFVLKSNTEAQIEACLTSMFALEVDPNEEALREAEEGIGLVRRQAKPVELSPQNAYIRRIQHQMAERANIVSRSRGREPFRRVRLYPAEARAWR